MKTSQIQSRLFMILFALTLLASNAFAADPGLPFSVTGEASDQKAGSLLYFNVYTSGTTDAVRQNSRVSLTNTSGTASVSVHMFFVDGSNCSVADNYLCLTPNQTASFLASDVDPGITGYIVAVAVDADSGLPIFFNNLIGDVYVKFSTGHTANLPALAFSKINASNVVSTDGSLAALFFDGLNLAGSYNRAPRVVAVDSLADRASGNDTLLILNRVGGNLGTGAATLSTLFGLLYDDAETPFSFSISAPTCQFRSSLSNSFPRTTPRYDSVIPAGRSGWMKIQSQSDIGITGAVINANAGSTSSSFNGGHNLHTVTVTAAPNLVIPVFPPNC